MTGEGAARVRLEATYARDVPALCLPWQADPAPAPSLLILNEPLARELGLDPDWLRTADGLSFLLGGPSSRVDAVPTVAQAYAGHQFGGYSPRLGDGRALLVGELTGPHDAAASGATSAKGEHPAWRRDLHLKGPGRTPFARGGDGKAVVGPMLREYLISEAMHALAIPTTRSLAVVATGESVMREGWQPGAVLVRVASSHLRVGTFQYAAALGDPAVLRGLADHAIARHCPWLAGEADAGRRYLAFYREVAARQARLIALWMGVGFIHGVMNTDNMTISGETIDYGPCAFMDAYSPETVFSSIDHGGRYAYGNQPGIAQWNLARLGETLLPLIDPGVDERPEPAIEAATGVLHGFVADYEAAFAEVMTAKLGLPSAASLSAEPGTGGDPTLATDLFALLTAHRVDMTSFFRALRADAGEWSESDTSRTDADESGPGVAAALFGQGAAREEFAAWAARRTTLVSDGAEGSPGAVASMSRANPTYIPRNHHVEHALASATEGDLGPFLRLLDAVQHPYDERPELADLVDPAPDDAPRHVTYCGT